MRILVVEDEEKIANFIRKGLEESSYTVDVVHSGEDALDHASVHDYATIILDLMLPGRDGLSVVRELRKGGNLVPILALTARNALDDCIRGLDTGCDDYLTKPFAFTELLARLRSLLRRHSGANRLSKLQYAGLVLDLATRTAQRDGRRIELTSKEYVLLELLLRHPRQVFTRAALLENVWGYPFTVGSNILDVYMTFLRKKIDTPGLPKLLHTVRGEGYILCEEAR